MSTKITDKIYLDKAQNGARTLFDLFNYRLLDGVKDEEESYFLIDFNEEPHVFYELELRDAYDLLAMYHVKCDKEFIIERICALIYSEDEDE